MGVRTLVRMQVDETMWQPTPEPTPSANWKGMLQATVAAVLVLGLLVGGVVLAWNTGTGPASSATLAPEVPPTPTPRVLALNPRAADAVSTTTSGAPAPEVATKAPAADVGGLVIVSTPDKMTLNAATTRSGGTAPASRSESDDKVLFAATASDFRKLAEAPWTATRDGLENLGDQAVATRWLTVAKAPGPGFIVEAEMRVTSTLANVCDQSFGITGGSQKGNQVFGGGVIFSCDGEPRARITDVLEWENGYNADLVLDEAPYTPGDDWRHYRFELDGTTLRLAINGEPVAETELDPGINPDADDLEVGLWSQGVGVQVREITVTSPA
jgi:hypothetical protein